MFITSRPLSTSRRSGRISRSNVAVRALAAILLWTGAVGAQQPRADAPPDDLPLRGVVVCIDPGHGGQSYSASYTGGRVGPVERLTESEASLNIATLLREAFRTAGAEVVMTRTQDRRVTPEGTDAEEEQAARMRIAIEAGAHYFISVHTHFANDPTIDATMVYYTPEDDRRELRFASLVGEAIARRMGTTFGGAMGRPYRAIHDAPMPAIIVEAVSLSNPLREKRLTSLSHCRDIAQAIFAGFLEFHKLDRRTQPTPAPKRTAEGAERTGVTRGAGSAPAPVIEAETTASPSPTSAVTPKATPRPESTPQPTPQPTPRATPRANAAATKPATPKQASKQTPKSSAKATPTPGASRRARSPDKNTPSRTPAPTTKPTPKPAPTARPTPMPTPPRTSPTPPPTAPADYQPLRPTLLYPVGGPIDQSWLFGEQYDALPVQRGVAFAVPEDSVVVAAAEGIVESVAAPSTGTAPPVAAAEEAAGLGVAAYRGYVILRHETLANPRGGTGEVWTVYGNLAQVLVAPGERVAAGEALGKTMRPYDGRPETRATAFQFEVRAGQNSPYRAVNPEPLLRAHRIGTGGLALRVVDGAGLPLHGVEIRGAAKDSKLYERYAYSMSYPAGVGAHEAFEENAYIGDLPGGRVTLRIGEAMRTYDIHAGQVTIAEWPVTDPGPRPTR